MSAICQNSNSSTSCQISATDDNINICSSSNTFCFGAIPSTEFFDSYTLTINNFISVDDRSSVLNYGIFNPKNYYMKNPITGKTVSLEDIYNENNLSYMNISYSISLTGTVNPTSECPISLESEIISTTGQKYDKNIFNYATYSGVNYDGSDWINLYSNANWLMDSLKIYTNQSAANGCYISSPYSNLSISLKIDISLDPYNYCTASGSNNIRNPSCYKFIKNQCAINGGCDENISSYLNNYCQRNYVDNNYTLSMLNNPLIIPKEDFELCSCNMPSNNYATFSDSLLKQGISSEYVNASQPSCLVPACYQSPFKSKNFVCSTPQCLNINSINDNNTATGVTFNGNNQCESYGFAPISVTTSPIAPAPIYSAFDNELMCQPPASFAPISPLYVPPTPAPVSPLYVPPTPAPASPLYVPPTSVSSGSTTNYTWVIVLAIILAFIVLLFVLFGIAYKKSSGKKLIRIKYS